MVPRKPACTADAFAAADSAEGLLGDDPEHGMRRKAHAQQMFAWQDQLALDGALGLSAQRVGSAIRRCVNVKTGDAKPSQAWLAKALKIDARNVRRGLPELVARGHLSVIAGRGPRSGNRYRPILRDDLRWPNSLTNEDRIALKTQRENRTTLPSKQMEMRTDSDSNEDENGRNRGQSRPPEPSSEPSSEPVAVPPRRPEKKSGKDKKKFPRVDPNHRQAAEDILGVAAVAVGKAFFQRAWPEQIAELEHEGIPPRLIVIAAWEMHLRGSDLSGISSIKYFVPLARELMEQAKGSGDPIWLDVKYGDLWCEIQHRKDAANERQRSLEAV